MIIIINFVLVSASLLREAHFSTPKGMSFGASKLVAVSYLWSYAF